MMAPASDPLTRENAGAAAVGSVNRRTILGIVAFVIVSMFLGWVGMAYDENMEKWLPEATANPSTYNRKPSGTSGFFEIVSQTGTPCSLWLLPYRQLKGEKGTLVVFAPNASLKPFEVDQILQWVKSGNKLVYFDHFSYSLARHFLDKLNIEIADGTKLKDTTVPASEDLDEFSHVKSLTVSTETRLKGGKGLLADKSGNLITKVKYGEGEIILGTTSSIASNQRLSSKKQWGNFQFLANVCRPNSGRLMFDERCHGYSKTSNVFVFFAKNPPGFTFAQLLLMLLLALYGSFHRFGKTRQIAVFRKLSSTEFIDGLSNVYQRAKANILALEIIGRAYRMRWCKTTGASLQDTTEELREKWLLLSRNNEAMQAWSQSALALLTKMETATATNKLNDAELLNIAQGLESEDDRLNEIFTGSTRKGARK